MLLRAPENPTTIPQAQEAHHNTAAGEHVFTLPNMMTAARAAMSVVLPFYMANANGGKRASLMTAIGAASDKESTVADLVDKRWPGWGRSELGKRADPIADTLFGAGVNGGILASPHTSRGAKAAAVISTIKVMNQTRWAIAADKKHRQALGEPYVADVGRLGKVGTFSMLVGTALATATGDLNAEGKKQGPLRKAAGIGAVLFATTGLAFGELARKKHDRVLNAKLQLDRKNKD